MNYIRKKAFEIGNSFGILKKTELERLEREINSIIRDVPVESQIV
mgnify:CR=1 FL=1